MSHCSFKAFQASTNSGKIAWFQAFNTTYLRFLSGCSTSKKAKRNEVIVSAPTERATRTLWVGELVARMAKLERLGAELRRFLQNPHAF